MSTGALIALIVAIVVVLLVVAFVARSRGAVTRARKEEQAREHLRESRALAAEAESRRAAADEQAARLRRERAELDAKIAREEAETQRMAQEAAERGAEADRLRERARKLAPHVVEEPGGAVADSHAARERYADEQVGGLRDRDGDGIDDRHERGRLGGPVHDRDRDGIDDRDERPGLRERLGLGGHDRDRGGVDDRDERDGRRFEAPVTDPDRRVTDEIETDAVRGREAREARAAAAHAERAADRADDAARADAARHDEPGRTHASDPAELNDHGSVGSRPLDGGRSATGDPVVPLDQRMSDGRTDRR